MSSETILSPPPAPQVSDPSSVTSGLMKGKLYTRTRRHKIRYPKNYDAKLVTVADPHRWLPRSQRPGQSRRKVPASFIRGPQGLVSSEERKPAGPSTAHIDLGTTTKKSKKGRK